MSEHEYATITPNAKIDLGAREPFRFQIDGQRFELPALDSADVPLPLIPIFLALAGGQVESDEDRVRIAGSFVAYLQQEQPKLWRVLKGKPNALAWVVGLIEQWGEHSRLDPARPASGS